MSLRQLSLFVFIVIFGLIFVAGCDEKSTAPTQEGEPDDTGFEMMSDLNGLSLDIMKIPFDLTDSVIAKSGSSSPLFKATKITTEVLDYRSLAYTYNNFWHIFTFTVAMVITEEGQTDSLIISGVDSLRYKNSGEAVQYPDEILTTSMDVRQHIDISAYSSDGSALEIIDHAIITVTAESFSSDVITLDGAINDTVVVSAIESGVEILNCDIILTSTQTYNGLVLDEAQECPSDGTIGMSAYYSFICEGEGTNISIESIWIATYTFSSGMVTVDILSGGEHWQTTDICGGV